MSFFLKQLIALVAAFFIGMILAPIFLKLSQKMNARQTLLSYLEAQHKAKKGTPTMGGFVFILACFISTAIFGGLQSSMGLVISLILLGYGVIGFLDDFIKVWFKRNMGLRAYQKIITQLAIAIIAALYCQRNVLIGTSINIPIIGKQLNLGMWYLPLAVITFIAMTNSVNLTDGLDGLAGTTNVIYFAFFLVIIFISLWDANLNGDILYQEELTSLSIFVASLIGAITAYLWFNSFKAKFIMGDTGALALGGVSAAVSLFVRNPLISIVIGIMFVVSSLSVIIQVVSFKLRKKRVFLMSPFHHHLELKGINESKIVAYYSIVTAIAGIIGLIIL